MSPRTRIVCTLGPASETDEVVRGLIRAGMSVARLNFSHGDHATHAASIERLRRLAREEGVALAILGDLQGPKIRVGDIAGGSLDLKAGSPLTLTTRPAAGDTRAIHVDFPDLPRSVEPGSRLLLDDGLIELAVVSKSATEIETRVVTGGRLESHKGVNLPGVRLHIAPLTEKDREDLAFAIDQGVDYIALSFVQRAEDVLELKRLLVARGATIPVIAKIEKPEAVGDIDAILDASDGLMVARGDLGVEAPPEQVPIYQKGIIRKANSAGKPVITATQMLESMVENPRPTRAEASDVANAILDGTDALMLSEETAMGKYPIETVQTMVRIAHAVEQEVLFKAPLREPFGRAPSITDAIGKTTCEIALQLGARAILTATVSGYTARMVSRHRPRIPIFAITVNKDTYKRLALVWGVQSVVVPSAPTMEAMVSASLAAALENGVVDQGDLVVLTAGVPVGAAGRTNMVQVRVVGEEL